MEQLDTLLKTTLGEFERMLSTKTVIGEPFEIRGNTIVPLIAVGFGFGGGGGSGEDQKTAHATGSGMGTGAGGGVRPIALIIVDAAGQVRVEPVQTAATVVEKFGEAVARVVESRGKAEHDAKAAGKGEVTH